jgi:hypothetical protein
VSPGARRCIRIEPYVTVILKRVAVLAVILFVVTVFGLFALNFYRRSVAVDEPATKPPVIFQRTDSPSRA